MAMNRKLDPQEAARYLADAGFVGWQVVRMLQIGYAESGLQTHAVNPVNDPASSAFGSIDLAWLQINSKHGAQFYTSLASLCDPAECARVAYRIFVARGGLTYPPLGYRAWTTYPKVSSPPYPFQAEAIAAAQAIGVYP